MLVFRLSRESLQLNYGVAYVMVYGSWISEEANEGELSNDSINFSG